jgi:O-antigen ligase
MLRGRAAILPPFPRISTAALVPAWLGWTLALAGALIGGSALGWLTVARGPVAGAVILIGLAGAVVVVSDVRAALWAVIGVVTLLPFGVIPVRAGLTLTLFETVALAAIAIWLLRIFLRRDELVATAGPAAWIALLLVGTLFAFLLGIGRGYTMETFHNYGKFVLAIALVYVVWNTMRSLGDARRLLTVILLGGASASAIGLALQLGGPGVTMAALSRLVPFGYPSSRIVRYIEDDPAKAMRLVSTSVDPNSFGGLLAVVFVLAGSQVIARNRVVPRWLTLPAAALTGAAMLFTQSRGAWVGAAAGLAIVAILRYRRLLIPMALGVAAIPVLGIGSHFIDRFAQAVRLEDPATKLRLSEYQNALEIIRQHPFFGVGFGQAPSVELQTGVSSIYLTIAEQTGLLGVALFVLAVGSILLAGFRYWRVRRDTPEGDLSLTLLAALGSALTVGLVDHYFFNISFPHMAALFWMLNGLLLALAIPNRPRSPRPAPARERGADGWKPSGIRSHR